jgi:aminoglycoside phosphotransferase (APT) family kinase protein
VPTTDAAVARVEREAAMLAHLAGCELGPLGRTLPRVVTMAEHEGRPVLVTTALPGRPLLVTYHRWRHTARPNVVQADFAAAGRWLAALQRRTAGAATDLAHILDGTADALVRRFGDDPETVTDRVHLAGLQDRLSGHPVPRVVEHGDFWIGNLLGEAARVSGVVDWEDARADGLPTRDLARFAIAYSLYLDRHTRPGRGVPGHPGLRAGVWGAGLDHALAGDGWYPEVVRYFMADGLNRLGVPGSCVLPVLLAEIARIAAEADHPVFARNHLLAYRRLRSAGAR